MKFVFSAAIVLALASSGFADGSIEVVLYQGESVQDQSDQIAFMTYVLSPDQERKAAVLIDSIRTFAGKYCEAPIYVALGDPEGIPCKRLAEMGAVLVPLDAGDPAIRYIYGIKPLACAEVEKLTAGKVGTLIYLDPESLVLAQPDAHILSGGRRVVIRPVHLVNNIGQPPSEPVDGYWGPIYQKAGVDPATVPMVETVVDMKKVRGYYCCIIMSVRPQDGIFQEWLRIFHDLIGDADYQREACGDFPHKIFLHQATLCGVINAKAKSDEIVNPPLSYTYPLGLYDRIPEERRLSKLSQIVTVAMEQRWDADPGWMDKLDPDEAHKAWLRKAYIDYYRVTDNIFRKEGSCNTYLIVTPAGSVVIDPGGAQEPSSPLLSLTENSPLKAILLTHAHTDHNAGYEIWNPDKATPVIAQREHAEFIHYHQRLAGFFAARDAVQGNVAHIDTEAEIAPTILFGDDHTFELGGFHFNIYHTPGETPDTSTIWIPELKAAFIGDNYYTSFPNLSPPRGSKPRWALDFTDSLEKILSLEPEMVFPGHGEPIIGAEEVRKRLGAYRDAVLQVHDAVVKGMNEGKDVYTLMREIKLPPDSGLDESYGKVSWGVRGIYEAYRGWYDGNPVNLYDQPISSIYPVLLDLVGNDDAIAGRAGELAAGGEEARALRLCDVVLEVKPDHRPSLEVRLKALTSLRRKCRNYIEARQLDHAIKLTREKLSTE